MNKLIPIAIIIAGLAIAGVFVYTNYSKCPVCSQEEEKEIISSDQAAEKLLNFVNNNILRGQVEASLIETLEEAGFYKVKFEVEDQEVEWQISRDGRFIFPQVIDLTEVVEPAEETEKEIGNFSVSSDEICRENNKPIIYFFGSEGCPHCVWEHPIVEEVAGKFGDEISFHNNMDSEEDMDVFQKYSTGGIPTVVLGCKYYRVGSGESLGKEKEAEALTSLICKLTDNQPSDVCSK